MHLPQADRRLRWLRAEAYTGPAGARGRSYTSFVRDGGAAFRSTRPFQPREGMTIVVAFPKGIVERADAAQQRLRWFLGDNRGRGRRDGRCAAPRRVPVLALVARRPRPARRTALPALRPAAGPGPAGVRYLTRWAPIAGCFAAALLGLGERGA